MRWLVNASTSTSCVVLLGGCSAIGVRTPQPPVGGLIECHDTIWKVDAVATVPSLAIGAIAIAADGDCLGVETIPCVGPGLVAAPALVGAVVYLLSAAHGRRAARICHDLNQHP